MHRRLSEKECLGCGVMFKPKESISKYCSKRCADLNCHAARAKPWREFTSDDLESRSEFVTETGCILWNGAINNRGYGVLKVGPRRYAAHRAAWEVFNGVQVPKGKCVMHTCDTPICINPDHLKIGTHAENMADRDAKGRGPSQFRKTHIYLAAKRVRKRLAA